MATEDRAFGGMAGRILATDCPRTIGGKMHDPRRMHFWGWRGDWTVLECRDKGQPQPGAGMAPSDLPPSLVGLAIDRIDLLGLHPIDRRDALVVLSLIAAGLDPEKVARSRDRARLSDALNLDVAGWPRVIAGLEAHGIISTPGHDGRRGIVR